MKLMTKFIVSLAVLGLILTVVISLFSYENSKGSLEEMYAEKVLSGSQSLANIVSSDDVKTIMGENGNKTPEYQEMLDMFNTYKQDGEITYLSLCSRDEDSLIFYIDGCVEAMGDDPANAIPYGTDIAYTDAAKDDEELQIYLTGWELYQKNIGTEEPLVTDNDYGYNYTALAPVLDENGKEIAEIQYIIDMNDVRHSLNLYLEKMILISLVIIVLALLLYIVFVRNTLLVPIKKLNVFTKGIVTDGELRNKSISLKTGDEIEELSDSFNYMITELNDYIDNLAKITAEKERIGAELNVATSIQASMLPNLFPAFPNVPEIDVYATMNPAKEVGGDFYDFFLVDPTHLAIVVADVSGKGVPAALFMVIGKTLIKDHTLVGGDLGSVFTRVNNLLCEANSEDMFITAFEGVLDLVTGELTFVNAGHEIPFIAKKNEAFKPHPIKAAFVLAGMEDMKYKAGSVMLEPGDKIFQYTDGVTEATNKNEELYGMERLEKALGECADEIPENILRHVKKDIDEFVGEAEQFDDITMLCLEYRAKMKAK